MRIMKSFATLASLAVVVFVLALLSDAYSLAEKACYAWTAGTTFSCTVSFLPVGFQGALRGNFWLSPFFAGGEIVTQPDANFGWLMLAGIIAALILSLFLIARKVLRFLRARRTHAETTFQVPPDASSPETPTALARNPRRKFSLDFFVILFLLTGLGWCVVHYMETAVRLNETRKETRFVPPRPSASLDLGLVMALMQNVQSHQLTPGDLRQQVEAAVADGKIDPGYTAKIYNAALGACHVDYLEVLENFPQQPSPEQYDAATMRSMYTQVKTPECDKYFEKMGWSKGCEVPPASDPCADLTASWNQYQKNFREAQKSPSAPGCATDADCFLSEAGICGERLVGSKLNIDPSFELSDNSLRCPLQKRIGLCLRQNPQAFGNCALKDAEVPVCRDSVCKMIPLREKLQPPTPSPTPAPVLLQAFLFKSDQDCFDQISRTVPASDWAKTRLDSVRINCDSKIFKDLAEIVHARVVEVVAKSDKSLRVRLKILKNYGRIALPLHFEMDWPPTGNLNGNNDITFEAPKVGTEGVFGFYEKDGPRVALKPHRPTLFEEDRRKVTPTLVALLVANQKKFPNPQKVRRILAAREANRKASCKHYDKVLGDSDLPLADVVAEKECPRSFSYFANENASNLLHLLLKGEPTVGEINERLKACGVQLKTTGEFFEIVAPRAKNLSETNKVETCLEEKGTLEAYRESMPVPDGPGEPIENSHK